MEKFKEGDIVTCKDDKPLSGNFIGPDLIIGEDYPVYNIYEDSKGNQHLNVGLLSELDYVKSWDTGEDLPNGNQIHWCHPSRFVKKENAEKQVAKKQIEHIF